MCMQIYNQWPDYFCLLEKNPRSVSPRGGIMSLWQVSQLYPLWLSLIPVLLEISSVIQNPISVLSSPRSCHFVPCRTKDGPRWKYKYAHRAEWAFKGGHRPQSTPHPSYAHKNSMSSSLPSVPPLLSLPDLALSSSPAFPSTIGVNHFLPAVFFPLILSITENIKVSFPQWYPQCFPRRNAKSQLPLITPLVIHSKRFTNGTLSERKSKTHSKSNIEPEFKSRLVKKIPAS